ncbi:MAG TPA: hypothetical protein VL126_14435 [Bacteroidota bacterium]|nr:hypothetical protein [Bacteroidota bacterium]
MTTRKTVAGHEVKENVEVPYQPRSGDAMTAKDMHAAIDRIKSELHQCTQPLEKIRYYEEIKRLEQEIATLNEKS